MLAVIQSLWHNTVEYGRGISFMATRQILIEDNR